MTRTARRRVVAVACVLVPFAAAIVLHDAGAIQAAAARLEADVERLRQRQTQLTAARRRADALRDELGRITSDLVRLQQILPYGLDVDAFRREIERAAAGYGVVVQEDATTIERDGRLIVATMKVLVRGIPRARRVFLEKLSRRARQDKLEVLEVRQEFLRGNLTFWAWDPEHPGRAVPCAVSTGRDPWTPLARTWIAARRASCLVLVGETQRDPDLLADLERFELVKSEVGVLVDQINEIQEKRTESWKRVLHGGV